jgi:hypothetical protein|tara:strand:- start:131 stop:415 length:285 start_codon:yes stop_codon:yes gene_type:complete
MPDNDKKVNMWNGGRTNVSHNEILRSLEDRYDLDDSEKEFREDLVERQKIMDKTRIKRPMHELYTNINYEEKTKISGMGGKGGPVEAMKSRNEK